MSENALLDTEHAAQAAAFLKGLANQHRLLVLCHLIDGEKNVGELLARSELSASALSQHIAVLKEQGFVTFRKEAQSLYYRLADKDIVNFLIPLKQRFCPDE
ncbi:ArsR/SmtB family transcription factor [Neptunicella marina]|uniref:Helix-turn-helix transcriptional regulator n=1 Tax=Neptunicella marina TaxID=2125989 RepID=A0A8J6ISM4_9ALTE|nr:metalloregulator ArsR/SmtB family transcription factor [Neptunicella marina]MBC3765107.1 helix-turn-helix transcriptional regulator [Neptunicella marina]